jgi:hypothetical protein
MVGAVRAVHANGAAEFGDRNDDCLPPSVAEIGLERVEGGVKPLKALSQQALRRALVLMGVETVATFSAASAALSRSPSGGSRCAYGSSTR